MTALTPETSDETDCACRYDGVPRASTGPVIFS